MFKTHILRQAPSPQPTDFMHFFTTKTLRYGKIVTLVSVDVPPLGKVLINALLQFS